MYTKPNLLLFLALSFSLGLAWHSSGVCQYYQFIRCCGQLRQLLPQDMVIFKVTEEESGREIVLAGGWARELEQVSKLRGSETDSNVGVAEVERERERPADSE